jgi:hypothetical protein
VRWLARLDVEERKDEQPVRLLIDVAGTFASESSAARAADAVLEDWRAGRVTLRDLVLRELAALYRRLRELHADMEPVAVPTTTAGWNRAVALWEVAGRLDADDAARYRDHVARAFDAAATTVRRHGLLDARSDPTP